VSDASPWWRDSGHSKGLFAFLTCSYGNGGTKSSKKCRNVTVPPIIMVVRKAFFDVGHSLKDQSKKPEKAGWEIHTVIKIDRKNTQFCP